MKMKDFGRLLVFLCILAFGRCESDGLQTYDIDIEPIGLAPMLSCSSESSKMTGSIHTIHTEFNTFEMHTLTNEDFDSVTWTTIEGPITTPECADKAEEAGGLMFHFHDGVCEVSMQFAFSLRHPEPSDLTNTKTVYIGQRTPRGRCRLEDGSILAPDTSREIPLKGCTNVIVLANCTSEGDDIYVPDVYITAEYFDLQDTCGTIDLSFCGKSKKFSPYLTECVPDAPENVASFVSTIQELQLQGVGTPIGVGLSANESGYFWGDNFPFPDDSSEWAEGEPSDGNGMFRGPYIDASGVFIGNCFNGVRECSMIRLNPDLGL